MNKLVINNQVSIKNNVFFMLLHRENKSIRQEDKTKEKTKYMNENGEYMNGAAVEEGGEYVD
ncbi:hypothetical protein BLOT_002856 [Blomia tropicalis]|nr:hypothetical protein BLOT_002856 [Blomia tropicalis]